MTERTCAHCHQKFMGRNRAIRRQEPECVKSWKRDYARRYGPTRHREGSNPTGRTRPASIASIQGGLFSDNVRRAVRLALETPAVVKAGRYAVVAHANTAVPQILGGRPVTITAERVLLVARRLGAKWEYRRPDRAAWTDGLLVRV